MNNTESQDLKALDLASMQINFEPDYARNLVENVLGLSIEVYFRPSFIGFDEEIKRNNPKAPVILVSNHSGMAFPWDATIFLGALLKNKNFDVHQVPRTLVAPILIDALFMKPFMLDKFWQHCGGVRATYKEFEKMMHYPLSNLMVYPEGIPGIGKGFNNKYQLQRMASSFIRMALKHQTDIQPYATVNAEYVNPYVFSWGWLNKHLAKIGIPFLPLAPHTILLLLQPWTFYIAFPAKLTYVKGKRIRWQDLSNKPYEELSEAEIYAIRDQVKAQMQSELDEAVALYGQNPFSWKAFFSRFRENIRYFPFFMPFGWPVLFSEFDRLWNKREGKDVKIKFGFGSFFRMLLQNPFSISYFIPVLGWIPIIIKARSWKKKNKNL